MIENLPKGGTHAWKLDAAVTALGSGALLLDVEVSQVTARSLDDADLVGPRVVPARKIASLACLLKSHNNRSSGHRVDVRVPPALSQKSTLASNPNISQRSGPESLTYCNLLFAIVTVLESLDRVTTSSGNQRRGRLSSLTSSICPGARAVLCGHFRKALGSRTSEFGESPLTRTGLAQNGP